MKIGVPKEIIAGERRVALAPDAVAKLVKSGVEVVVEAGAGNNALFPDDRYIESGAKIEPDASTLLGNVDLVLKVQAPVVNQKTGKHEVTLAFTNAEMRQRALFNQVLNEPKRVFFGFNRRTEKIINKSFEKFVKKELRI